MVDARCGNCEFFLNGCPEKPGVIEVDLLDVNGWCPDWDPMTLDPDANEEEEDSY